MNERPEKQYRERNAREPRRQIQVEYRRGIRRPAPPPAGAAIGDLGVTKIGLEEPTEPIR